MLIYKVTNIINNKVYIGQTVKQLSQRKSEHKHRFLFEDSHNKFYNALKKYGWDNFVWEVLEESADWTYEILDEKEKYYIKLYDSINKGYNILEGGNCSRQDGEKMAIACGSKPFYAFNIKGEFLGEFINKTEFARQYNITVQRVVEMVNNTTYSAKGIIVIDKEKYTPALLKMRLQGCVKKLPFVAVNKQTNEQMGIFTNIEECKRQLGLPKSCHIGEVLKGQRQSSNGYIFYYIE